MAKKAKRVLRRINGKLVVVYIDVETGEVLSSLDGYELVSQDATTDSPSSEGNSPTPQQPVQEEQRGRDYVGGTGDPYAGTKYRPVSTSGDILGDFQRAGQELQRRADETKQNVGNAITGLFTRIGIALMPEDMKREIARDAIDSAKESASNLVSGVSDWLFGGGDSQQVSAAPPTGELVSPNEMFEYGDIAIRDMPLSNEFFTKAAAGASAINPDLRFVISSAGQTHQRGPGIVEGVDYTGTHRHDVDPQTGKGSTADIVPMLNGERVTYQENPQLYKDLIRSFATVGFTGIGLDVGNGYIHVGGGDPAVWDYDGIKGTVPPGVREAYDAGAEANRRGEGQQLLKSYREATVQMPTALSERPKQFDRNIPQTYAGMEGVSPSLQQAVTGYKEARGQSVAPIPQTAFPMSTPQVGPMAEPQVQQSQVPQGFDYTVPPMEQPQVVQQPAQRPSRATAVEAINQAAPVAAIDQQAPQGFMNAMAYAPANQPIESGEARLNALLDAINYAEGSPKANDLFGYGNFDSFDRHPNEKVYYNNGKDFSTAAGLFQINAPTYGDYAPKLGITTFTEEDQRRIASEIAKDRYARETGRDLIADLSSDDPSALERVFDGLSGTWSSLPSGSQARTKYDELKSVYDNAVSSYSSTQVEPPKASRPTRQSGFMSEPVVTTPTTSESGVVRASRASSSSSSSPASTTQSRVGSTAVSRDYADRADRSSGSSSTSSTSRASSSGGFMGSTPKTPQSSSSGSSSSSSSSGSDYTKYSPFVPKQSTSTPTKQSTSSITTKTQAEKNKESYEKQGYSYNPSGR